MAQNMNSRRSRTVDKQMKKQLILSGIGIVILLFLIFKYGIVVIQSIGNFSSSLQQPETSNSSTQNTPQAVLRPPQLDTIPQATKNPTITITGTASDTGGSVQIYVNDNLAKTVSVSGDSSFTANNIPLSEGENDIKANYKKDGKTSDFTQEYTIQYANDAPTLTISSPSDQQQFTRGDQEITVTGKTDPDSSVTVNGFRAVVDNQGNFSYYLQLKDGDNQITVEADNPAGLSTKQQITVSYHG